MYNQAGAGSGALAMTGLAYQGLWLFLAGFALLALSLAVLRLVPRGRG